MAQSLISQLCLENDELKAENEQLKTKVFKLESKQTSMCEQNKELIEDNLNLSKENERLKEEIQSLQYSCAEYSMRDIDTATILFAKDKAELESKLSLANAYVNKYKSCLQEIEKILYEQLRWQGQLPQCELEILQKISEVME